MISLAILVISLVLLAAIYSLRPYFVVVMKAIGDISPEIKLESAPTGAVDIGLWGTLRVFWKIRTVFWDGTPSYAKVYEILQHYKSKMMRMVYLTNWKSASRVVLLSDLKTIREVFYSCTWLNRVHDDHYLYKESFGKPLGIIFGNGAYWKAARKAAVKGFRDSGLTEASRVEEVYSDEVQNVLADLRNLLKDSTTAVFSPNHLTDQAHLNASFKMLFGRKPFKDDPLENRLSEMIVCNIENFGLGLCAADVFPYFKHFLKLLPCGRAHANICNAVYTIVKNERDRRRQSNSEQQDIMNTLLKEVEANEGTNPNYFTFENLQTTVRDLIIGGTQSPMGSLEHFIFFMATNREEQKKVQDEIDRVIGPDRFPTYDDRKSMIYTQAVMQESWRLGSGVVTTVRMNEQDCQLGGMDLKKGTYVVPLYLGVNHNEELWEDPMLFKPTRFISDSGQLINTDKTLTFACGPRACPGELFGRVAVFLFTVTLLREFDWELSDMHPPPSSEYRGGFTKTRAEYFVKIRRRRNQV